MALGWGRGVRDTFYDCGYCKIAYNFFSRLFAARGTMFFKAEMHTLSHETNLSYGQLWP